MPCKYLQGIFVLQSLFSMKFFKSKIYQRSIIIALILIFSPICSSAFAASKPRLAIVIVVDQMRADYLQRFGAWFLPAGDEKQPGGFNFLRERGAEFTNAHYRHFPLFTGPGHAVVATGGYPYKNGIIANDWYSKSAKANVYCVQDPNAKLIGGGANSKAKPMSPKNLLSTTIGDELKMATGGAGQSQQHFAQRSRRDSARRTFGRQRDLVRCFHGPLD